MLDDLTRRGLTGWLGRVRHRLLCPVTRNEAPGNPRSSATFRYTAALLLMTAVLL